MEKRLNLEERILNPLSGFTMLFLQLILFAVSVTFFVIACIMLARNGFSMAWVVTVVITSVYYSVIFPIMLCGLKIIHPNEAGVYTLFGKYYGTISAAGFYWINPFCSLFNPAVESTISVVATQVAAAAGANQTQTNQTLGTNKKVSLRAMTLNNDRQKINDMEGNPIDIGVVVIWRVVNATKAVFEVENFKSYLSIQCDAAIRNVARQYPYDMSDEGDEKSLRGSSQEIADELRKELQNRVSFAGLEIMETRIAHLAYAQEIAAAMLQRQQAAAIVAAKQRIVEGAVGMVESALQRLSERNVVHLDDERKAAMVSNLLVVLCGTREAQPVVNSGSLY
jgi:regulator of protease activity HflC (stomatin/prohibitin superfamily)